MKQIEEPLGIPSSGYEYMKISPEQIDLESKLKEFFGIQKFLIEEKCLNSWRKKVYNAIRTTSHKVWRSKKRI